MNIFVINWDYNENLFLEIAERLEGAGCKIPYWVGGGFTDATESSQKRFSQTIFHNHHDAILGKPAKELKDVRFTPPGEEIIKNLYEAESILLTIKHFERLEIGGFEKKNLYHYYLEYWLGIINKFKPEAIIFAIYPHAGYNFILYSLAKLLKIKTIMFEYSGITDRHLLINDFTVGSQLLKRELAENKNKQFTLNDLSQDIKDSYLRKSNNSGNAVSSRYNILKNKYSGINLLILKLKIIKKSLLDLSIFKKIYLFFQKKFGRNLKKEYIKLQTDADFNKKFIYLAMHYQPELATSPLGGVFANQILMIKILSAATPEDWLIYVKEHPDHWLMQGFNYSNARYRGYYETLSQINKVKLIPAETSTSELIKKSQTVVTVTGTAGREAVLQKKPVIIFGYAPYRDMPGVFKVNSVESCRAVLAKINSGFEVKEQEIINYLVSFDKVSFHGYFENLVKAQSKLTQEELIKSFYNAVMEDLKEVA